MAGIYIKGMEMPQEGTFNIVHIYSDGRVSIPYWGKGMQVVQDFKAIPVPGHGKLIDADTLADRLEKDRTFILHAMMEAHKKSEGHTREDYLFDRNGDFISILRNQAAVIPADQKEEE